MIVEDVHASTKETVYSTCASVIPHPMLAVTLTVYGEFVTGPLADRSELAQLTKRGLVPSIVNTPAGGVGVIVVVYTNGLQQV